MPGVSGVTVVTNARVYYHYTRGCGRIGRPAFPAPSVERAGSFRHNPRESRRGIEKVCLPSLRGVQATKQSILSWCGTMDCFAEPVIGRRFAPTRWLAMTAACCLKPESNCDAGEEYSLVAVAVEGPDSKTLAGRDDLEHRNGVGRPQRNWLVICAPSMRIGDTKMTYCCGVLVRDGLVMIADTRTNAGLDNVSTFRKLHIFSKPGERVMAIASAGNLAISQSVLSTLTEGLEDPHSGEIETLLNAPTMFQAAQRIGKAIRAVHATEGTALQSEDINFDVSFLFGGQIKGSRMRLFMVYPAGNFIECTTDTPYLQIGEHKYGKPVLDRAMHYDVELYEALKTSLISMDSTMRSNLGVGLPIDVLVVRSDVCDADLNHRIEAGEPYFHDLRSRWSAALRAAHQNIPRPPYKTETPKT
jgi:putative proteasome-type protease